MRFAFESRVKSRIWKSTALYTEEIGLFVAKACLVFIAPDFTANPLHGGVEGVDVLPQVFVVVDAVEKREREREGQD